MKSEILYTSLKQFLKYGIREMSIQKLVEPLGISTKTVYKYFKNKEELLEEALYLFHAQQHDSWKEYSRTQTTVSLFLGIWQAGFEIEYSANKAFFQDLHHYYPDLARRTEDANSKVYKSQFIGVIHQGMQEGVFRDDIRPDVVFESISVLYKAIVREGHFNSFQIPSFDILANTIVLLIRGFCTERGIQELSQHIQTHRKNRKSSMTDENIPVTLN